jgi:hypothetical protein
MPPSFDFKTSVMQNLSVGKKNKLTSFAAMGWGTWVAYFIGGWLTLAFMGYGIALNQYSSEKGQAQGLVLTDEVQSRWAWGFGLFGDVCFRLKLNKMGWFCVAQDYLVSGNGHPGNLFPQLAPGTPVKVKAQAGRVTELTVYPDSNEQRKTVVVYGYAIGKVQEELRASQGGLFYFVLALLVIPGIWASRRFLLPALLKKAKA